MSIKKVIKVLRKYDSFLITSHVNMEGDAVACQLAMAKLLQGMRKKVYIVDNDPIPVNFLFLPKTKEVSTDLSLKRDFQVALVMDCPTLKRIGKVQELITPDKVIVNIDHHVSNERFGAVDWVKPFASSAGELVWYLYKEMRRKLTKEAALYIYTAILTDTGSFTYDNTRPNTHEIASDLLSYGLDPAWIAMNIYERRSLEELRLLGAALTVLKLNEARDIAHIEVTQEMLRQAGTDISKTDNVVNYARSIDKVVVAIVFRENPNDKNLINVSFRSKGEVDVNNIASLFGGGGHKRAAGCTVRGNLEDVKRQVLEKTEEFVRQRRQK
jgi:phosphoesterase RecJ-like protein